MAETFNSIINRVRTSLLASTQQQEQYATLSVSMGASDGSFTVDPATVANVGRGIMEIEDELVLVQSVDRTSGIVTVQGGVLGRGWNNTVAAAHTAPALCLMSPAWPRARIKETINDTIGSMYPDLVIFSDTEITKLAPVYEYPLPADVADVWYLTGQMVGPTKIWQPLPNWRYNPKADTSTTTDFPTGKSIQIFDFVTPGQKIKVVYAKTPGVLVNNTDVYNQVVGYDDTTVDIVTYGAISHLLPMYESSRLQQRAIESTERAGIVVQGSAMKTSQYYFGLYQQRLAQEREQQMNEIPNYATFQGS